MMEQTEAMRKMRGAGIVFWTILGGLALGYVIFWILGRIGSVLTPFLLAVLLVYILRPLVGRLDGWGVPRLLSVLLAYMAAILVVGAALVFLIPVLAVQVQEFVGNFPAYIRAASRLLSHYGGLFERAQVDARVAGLVNSALERVQETGLQMASSVPAYTLSAVGLLFNLVLAPVIAFFLLKDLDAISATALGMVPERHRDEMIHLTQEVDAVLAGFLRGQTLIALSVAVLSTIILMLLGVDFAVVIGLLTGLLSVIPYFGPLVGALVAGLVALLKSPVVALVAVLLLLGAQQVVNVTVAPYIMSQQVNVHPVVVIFALLVGGSLFGITGLVLAIPVAAIAKALFVHFAEGHHLTFARPPAPVPRKRKAIE